MKTMDCSTLGTLIENRELPDVIDIRSKAQFRAGHIPGARWIPFAQLAKPKGFRRWRPTVETVYVVSDDRVKASLATGILRACGHMNATVVEGGINAWRAQGFRVSTHGMTYKFPNFLNAGSIALGLIAGCAVVSGKFLIAGLIMVSAAALFVKAILVTRTSLPSVPMTPAC